MRPMADVLGGRSRSRVLRALVGREHYLLALNAVRLGRHPIEQLRRYVTGRGEHPYRPEVRTPAGPVRPTLHSPDDVVTLSEIFYRLDYRAPPTLRTVVDLGSNIGISALYFLTRNDRCTVHCYEPDDRNVERLRVNLADFEDRYHVHQRAVADRRGTLRFGVEPTGRYGGIGLDLPEAIDVECVHINDVLEPVIAAAGIVDVLKIDTEGVEVATVEAIDPELAARVRCVYLEANPDHALLPGFRQRQRGSVCQLWNQRL